MTTITLTEEHINIIRQCLTLALRQTDLAGARKILEVDAALDPQPVSEPQESPVGKSLV